MTAEGSYRPAWLLGSNTGEGSSRGLRQEQSLRSWAAGGPGALLLPGTQPPSLPTARAHGSQLAGSRDLNTETGSKDSPNKPGLKASGDRCNGQRRRPAGREGKDAAEAAQAHAARCKAPHREHHHGGDTDIQCRSRGRERPQEQSGLLNSDLEN